MNNKKRYYKNRGGRNRNSNNQSNHLSINKVYDSNGPAGKVRGNAHTIYEKYQTLARDAQASGDRVLAENYLQHAEHYLRIIHMIQEQMQTLYKDQPQSSRDGTQEISTENDEDTCDDDEEPPQDETSNNEEKKELNVPFLRRNNTRRKPQRTQETEEIDGQDNSSDEIPAVEKTDDTPSPAPTVRRRRVVRRRTATPKEDSNTPNEAPEGEE